MNPSTHTAAHALFGRPALSNPPLAPEVSSPLPQPLVSATATGSFTLGHGPRVVTVDVKVGPVIVSVLVRAGRVVGPMQRGGAGVRFSNARVRAEARTAAVEAALEAERRGWLA